MAIGQPEILIIILIIVILFGAAAIPKLARSLGRAQGEFKKARGEFEKELKEGEKEGGQAPSAPNDAAPVAPQDESEKVRRSAEQLGISTEGKTTEELKAAIKERLG